MPFKKIALLFFTLRHLKPIQFYWRIYLKHKRLRSFNAVPPAVISLNRLSLLPPVPKHTSLVDDCFVFLNHAAPAKLPVAWNDAQQAKLWLYNLHYFDYINQPTLSHDKALMLIDDWIQQNPVGEGNGWEPYTLSLRIVNWIKFLSSHSLNQDLSEIQASLYVQCRYLFEHLEYHLLGNHLFKNGVALLYGGTYFQGEEAAAWLQKGQTLLETEIPEQVLADGGHFERSPMYHLLILEDILDCLNLHQSRSCFSETTATEITMQARNMLAFALDTQHPDGEIAFFNDSALRIAPTPGMLAAYAGRLGIDVDRTPQPTAESITVIEKPDFGIYVIQNACGRMIFDAGVIGPDYLPGHAHCDTLSYELSLFGQRCIVNAGTYQYAGQERNLFRATAAHNTVRIDGAEQHEIWSTFRVARRGYPFDLKVERQAGRVLVSAAHSGYRRLPGQPVHRRILSCHPKGWQIDDRIEGRGQHVAESFIHLHPAVEIVDSSKSEVVCAVAGKRFVIGVANDVALAIMQGTYSPEFGLKQSCNTLVMRVQGACPFRISYTITMA